MVNGINHQKPSIKTAQDAGNSKTAPAQILKPSAQAPSVTVRPAVSPAAASGLPSDKLSASIVSFARFFSLPLKPQLLADIRRNAFAAQPSLPESAQYSAKTREPAKRITDAKQITALSLAAAAAESKGAELHSKGLESYAQAVDPDSRRHNDGQRRRRRDNDQNEKEPVKSNAITANNLKKMSLEYLQENPVVDIINRLPGKNGQRWIVLPFDFSDGKNDYYVTMRFLACDIQVLFALDVGMRESGSGEFEKRWLFTMEKKTADKKPAGLSVVLQPRLFEKEHLHFVNELSKFFDIPPEQITIKYAAGDDDSFPFEAQLIDPPQSVNEAV